MECLAVYHGRKQASKQTNVIRAESEEVRYKTRRPVRRSTAQTEIVGQDIIRTDISSLARDRW